MFLKKIVIIAGLMLLITVNIVILAISSKYRSSSYEPERIVISVVAPFQKMATQVIHLCRDLWHHYFFLVSVAAQNDELKQKVSSISEKANRCQELELSNERLRSLLNFQQTMTNQFLPAEVIGKDPSPWFKSIIIDKGWIDGIKKGMPVVTPDGIAGVITDISRYYSKVLLIIDQNCAVDGLVQRNRSRGIVKGKGEGLCLFKYVSQKDDINVDDIVISSGLDGIFPKGLRVGRISDVIKGKAVFQEVMVTPYVDFAKIEEVLVLLNPSKMDPGTKK